MKTEPYSGLSVVACIVAISFSAVALAWSAHTARQHLNQRMERLEQIERESWMHRPDLVDVAVELVTSKNLVSRVEELERLERWHTRTGH